jgi:hypothetical protein
MQLDLDALQPIPTFRTICGRGSGLAVCPTLGLLVTSSYNDNALRVFALPASATVHNAAAQCGSGLSLLYTLGGPDSPAPMRFKFTVNVLSNDSSGWMAFTGPATCRLLLVTDAVHDAVHVIDVVRRVHAGYVAAPGTIAWPRGVAARASLVAVSAWKGWYDGDHVVHLFEGSGSTWDPLRVLACGFGRPGAADGQLRSPHGLRFTADGTGLAVADFGNGRVCMFRVEDGSFVRHVATGLEGAWDVEECAGGWLVACGSFRSHTVSFVGDTGGGPVHHARLSKAGSGDGEFRAPSALALVPDLGLVVRERDNDGRVQFFTTPGIIAMAAMSRHRVGWMVAVARGVAARSLR